MIASSINLNATIAFPMHGYSCLMIPIDKKLGMYSMLYSLSLYRLSY